jgi:photosystem II stability/assembly factor-like uncharacterized protein
MKKSITILMCLCVCALSYSQWQHSGGPEGVDVINLYLMGNSDLIAVTGGENWISYSTDNGDNWNQASLNGLPTASFGDKKTFTKQSVLYFHKEEGNIYKSDDHGESWSETSANITETVHANKMLYFNDTIYLYFTAPNPDVLYKSGDDGQNWMKETISGSKLSKLTFNTIISDGVWISPGSGGIYYSEDQGQNWQQATGDVGSTYTFSVAKYNGKLFATSTDEVYISEDDGKSWTTTDNQDRGDIRELRVLSGKLFGVSRWSGIYEISSDGTVFTVLDNGLTQPRIQDLVESNNILFAATPVGIYRSGNAGSSWSRANNGIGYSTVYQFANMDSILFAATSSGVWRSKSYGQRWVPMGTPDIKFNSVITLADDIYAACEEGVYKSADTGKTFTLIGSNYPIVIDPVIGTNGTDLYLTAYQGSENGTYVLSSFSGSWTEISGVDGAVHIWQDPSNDYMYIGKSYSDDGGSSWSSVSGLGNVGKVHSYQRFNGKVYAGVFEKVDGYPFLFNADDGTSFSSFISGINADAQTTFLAVVGDSLIVDADIAGGNSEIYYKTSSDASFSLFDNSGLPNKKVEPIYYNGYSLFVSSSEGIYRYDLKTLPEVPDTVDQIEYPPVSIIEDTKNEYGVVTIFPNPVSDLLTIQSPKAIQSANIYDLGGKLEKQSTAEGNTATIDMTGLNAGMYLLRVQGQDGKVSMHKIIKQ